MRRKPDISSLLSLLDDEDEATAVEAMANLLDRGDEVAPYLAELQESPDPLLRRRVHQLESALTVRRRRNGFSRLLAVPRPDIARVLVELHLQWFDNDPLPEMAARVAAFIAGGRNSGVRNLNAVSAYFRKCGIVAEHETTLRPENYCVGVALADRVGAASLWVLLAKLLLPEDSGVRIVRHVEEFALCEFDKDRDGNWIDDFPDGHDHSIDAVRYATERIWRRKVTWAPIWLSWVTGDWRS